MQARNEPPSEQTGIEQRKKERKKERKKGKKESKARGEEEEKRRAFLLRLVVVLHVPGP